MQVAGAVTDTGFTGTLRSGDKARVTFDHNAALVNGPFAENQQLRILGALVPAKSKEIQLLTRSEVFFR